MTDITLTQGEIAALIATKISEHEQAKEREVERIRQLQNPPSTPAPSIGAPPELMAELTKILDANGGDVDKALNVVLHWLAVDINERPTNPDFRAVFYQWSFARDVLPHAWALMVRNVLLNMQRQRANAVKV